MQEELNHLDYTIEKYNEVIDDSKLKLSNLKKLYKDYEEMLEEKFRLEREIKSIEKVLDTPYFARIDFESENNMRPANKMENRKIVLDFLGKLGII